MKINPNTVYFIFPSYNEFRWTKHTSYKSLIYDTECTVGRELGGRRSKDFRFRFSCENHFSLLFFWTPSLPANTVVSWVVATGVTELYNNIMLLSHSIQLVWIQSSKVDTSVCLFPEPKRKDLKKRMFRVLCSPKKFYLLRKNSISMNPLSLSLSTNTMCSVCVKKMVISFGLFWQGMKIFVERIPSTRKELLSCVAALTLDQGKKGILEDCIYGWYSWYTLLRAMTVPLGIYPFVE